MSARRACAAPRVAEKRVAAVSSSGLRSAAMGSPRDIPTVVVTATSGASISTRAAVLHGAARGAARRTAAHVVRLLRLVPELDAADREDNLRRARARTDDERQMTRSHRLLEPCRAKPSSPSSHPRDPRFDRRPFCSCVVRSGPAAARAAYDDDDPYATDRRTWKKPPFGIVFSASIGLFGSVTSCVRARNHRQ